jgi:leader peptidase (prepilin peptidase)/N-methyltransferase
LSELARSLPPWLVYPFAVAFGAVCGSFLNVVVVRLPRGESLAFPGSHCMACGAPIRAYDNIPVLSYLWLRGRCRRCQARFSARYALVEAVCGAAAAAMIHVFGLSLAAMGFFVFFWLLLGIAAIDLKHWIIPHELSWSGIALGVLFAWGNPRANLRSALLGAALAWAAFTVLAWVGQRVFKKEALGLGDRWLLAMEGAFLGWGALLPIVFLASLQGSVVGLLLIATGRAQSGQVPPEPPGSALKAPGDEEDWIPPRNALPFGPFLALAALEWLFLGPSLWGWYQTRLFEALA